jgi:transcriptional regulator with XRE-family HTH domain
MARGRPQSRKSRALERRMKALQRAGLSVREIGRRTGVSKSQVHNILTGKRRASERAAEAALVRLGPKTAKRKVVVDGKAQWVRPLRGEDFTKWGKWSRTLREASAAGDYRMVGRELSRKDLTMHIAGAGGKRETIRLEADPAVLRQLDDASALQHDVIKTGPTPTAGG